MSGAASAARDIAQGGDWAAAVAEFGQALTLRGYSRLTVRDYCADAFRLAEWAAVAPEDLAETHLSRARQRDGTYGFATQTQRRRASAYSMFHAWMQRTRGTDDPAQQLLAAESPLELDDRLMVALVALAGLRLNEARTLEGRDVLLKKQLLRTRCGWRLVPLHPLLLRIIEDSASRHPQHSYRPLLSGPGGFAVHERTLHGRFQRLALHCGLPGLTSDALRRATAARLRTLGTPPTLVRAFIGLERSQPLAPRSGRFLDLSCMRERIARLM